MKLTMLLVSLTCCMTMAVPSFTLSKARPLQIATSPDATPAEQTAAEELHDYILKLCGADCKITNEKNVQLPAIYLGWTETARKAIGSLEKLDDEEWVIRTENGSLIITGGRPRGTLYGVYEFLEGQGIVWPDETTEYIPSLAEIKFDAPIAIQDKPAIRGRRVYSGLPVQSNAAVKFYVRNKMNHEVDLNESYGYSMSMGSSGFCHTFHAYTQPDWPDEWFAMNASGQRIRSISGAGPGQLCLTNPELRKAMVKRLKSFIAKDRKDKPREAWPRIYDISHNDNGNYCVCPECKALAEREGGNSGPMIDFVNYIANAIAKDYPDILVQTFAYSWTLEAPKTIHPAKNVMIRVCKTGCEVGADGADTQFSITHPRNKSYYENFLKWAAISSHLAVWDYWIIYAKGPRVPPYINYSAIQQDIKLYRNYKVKTMFAECEEPISTSFTYFKYWFGLKMMQNPDMPYDKLANAFCKAYYGPAARPMRQYLDYLQARETAADVCLGTAPMTFRNLMGNTAGVKIPDILQYVDEEFLLKANSLLDEAERLATGNKACLEHISHERIPVDVAILGNLAKYRANPPVGTLIKATPEALFDRYAANVTERTKIYYASDIYKRNPTKMQECINDLASLRKSLLESSDALPPQFRDKCCLVYTPSMMDGRGKIVDDPDAVGKKAFLLQDGKNENYHRLPFSMGVYNRTSRKSPLIMELKEEDLPQDGKFHWYKLGRCQIKPNTIVWVHWTWYFQTLIDGGFLTKDGDNSWDVNISLKLSGNPYINGSTEIGRVLVESIILVK